MKERLFPIGFAPLQSDIPRLKVSKMLFSKSFTSNFLRSAMSARPSVVKLFDTTTPLTEVTVHEPNMSTYTAISINPYTLEEQLIMYPVVIVHDMPKPAPPIIIDIE